MTRPGWTRGVGFRIAAAAIGTTALGVGIVALGIVFVGADTFARLMAEHGGTEAAARAMFDQSVTLVLIIAVTCRDRRRGRALGPPRPVVGAASRRDQRGRQADRGRRLPRPRTA